MGPSQSVAELVAAAQARAKGYEDRISDILELTAGQQGSTSQVGELREATVALKLAAVDIFTLFEARMQHHFKRGPFSRKLSALLLKEGQAELAGRVHQYYLVVNVLKHGKGASYRELLDTQSALFVVRSTKGRDADDVPDSVDLVDIVVPGFFSGLTETILEATDFLEKR